MAAHLAYSVAGLTAIGGLTGYIRQKSVPSLIAGLAFAGLYATSGSLIAGNKDFGVELATLTSLLLSGAMVPRAIKTRKRKCIVYVLY